MPNQIHSIHRPTEQEGTYRTHPASVKQEYETVPKTTFYPSFPFHPSPHRPGYPNPQPYIINPPIVPPSEFDT